MYVSPFIKMTIEEELGHEKEQDAENSHTEEQIPLNSGDMELVIQTDLGSNVITGVGTDEVSESNEVDALQTKTVETEDGVKQCGSESPIEKISMENLESQDESKKKSFDRKCGVIAMLLLAVIIFGAIASLIIIKKGSKQVHRTWFRFAVYFGDHMVLQRAPNRAVVWGYSSVPTSNATVQLLLEGKDTKKNEYTSEVSADGTWKFVLEPVDSPGPFLIRVSTVATKAKSIELKDVLFGDVWLCAGQNNMQRALDKKTVNDADFENLDDLSNIRLLSLWPDKSSLQKFDISQPEIPWSLPSRESLLGIGGEDVNNGITFSGLCWLYGKELYGKLRYPVGLVSAAYSFSSIEDWASQNTLDMCNITAAYLTSTVYNALVKPLFTTSLYGIIWYQGESDAVEWFRHYHCILVEMIKNWRNNWLAETSGATESDLPFGIVQLGPNEDVEKEKYGYPDLRWQQTADYGYVPNPLLRKTFMAVALDLPLTNSSAERPQLEIAKRLVKGSMVEAYQQKGEVFQGPLPTSYTVFKANQSMLLHIDAMQLDVRDTVGFEVCCANSSNQTCTTSFKQVSYAPGREWASAAIVSHSPTSLTLSWQLQQACEQKSVVGLRYLWSEKPCKYLKCPIYDGQSGLPMPPYIRLRLQDNGQHHSLSQDQTFLL